MNMSKISKKLRLILVAALAVTISIGISYYNAHTTAYPSQDPLYGTFSVVSAEGGNQPDYFLSINVNVTNAYFQQCAEESGVDISTGCWVYSYAEKKIFPAEKQEDTLVVYDDMQGEIGEFRYSSKTFLWAEFDKSYQGEWRGECFDMERIMQGYVLTENEAYL
jgi:hypothetical protein